MAAQMSQPIDARDLPKDTHRRLRLAALWLGVTMRDFLVQAIEAKIIAEAVPEAVLSNRDSQQVQP